MDTDARSDTDARQPLSPTAARDPRWKGSCSASVPASTASCCSAHTDRYDAANADDTGFTRVAEDTVPGTTVGGMESRAWSSDSLSILALREVQNVIDELHIVFRMLPTDLYTEHSQSYQNVCDHYNLLHEWIADSREYIARCKQLEDEARLFLTNLNCLRCVPSSSSTKKHSYTKHDSKSTVAKRMRHSKSAV